ncbi:MAG: OmpA family protein [Myxococcales bacterium]|nr:OmpA family protein [Myxococcales bacterium]
MMCYSDVVRVFTSPSKHLLTAFALAMAFGGCRATTPDVRESPGGGPTGETAEGVELVDQSKLTRELQETAEKLAENETQLDDQKRRLQRLCADYPDHEVCQPQTAAAYAKKAFCSEAEFTKHVGEIVDACHQGQCKQVDQATLLSRTQYMTLVQSLPHSLVMFPNAGSKLDTADQKQLQRFIELIQAEDGFVIIVGRASRDGVWKQNLRLALDRAENTREFLVGKLGLSEKQVGYITYGHDKMYLTALDVQRLTTRKVSPTQGNRSALVFAYPCRSSKTPAASTSAPQ